jgi:hypothetical protein
MSSVLACFPLAAQLLPSRNRRSAPQLSSITSAKNTQWQAIAGSAREALLPEMEKMYWNGVKREMTLIMLTMKKWQQDEYGTTILDDEEDGFIHGYDTFTDQVSESARDFAARYGKLGALLLWNRGLTFWQRLGKRNGRKGTRFRMRRP